MLQVIVRRYADAQYAIDFDSFLGCLIKLEMLFSKCLQTWQYHNILICIRELRHVYIASIFLFVFQPEMFKALEKADSGKIDLDIQQVCGGKTLAANFFFFSTSSLHSSLYNFALFYSGCASRSTSSGHNTSQDLFVISAGR